MMSISIEEAKAQYPDAVEVIEAVVASAKSQGCDCEPVFKTREEMDAEWEWLTPQQRVNIIFTVYPGALFCDHEVSCPKHRASMAPYN